MHRQHGATNWTSSWICAAFLVLFTAAQVFAVGLTNDTQMLLLQSRHLLYDGGLYTRWVAVNSPLIYLLYTVPLFIAIHTGIAGAVVVHALTALACGASLLFLRQLLGQAALTDRERHVFLLAAACALLAAPVLSGTFADREHYLFILLLPWAMVRVLRLPAPGRAGLTAAALAALGCCIKPYNVILVAVLLLFGGPRDESLPAKVFSRATLTMTLTAAAYVLLLLLLFPAYLTRMLPLASLTYAAVAHPLRSRVLKATACLVALLIPMPLLRTTPDRRVTLTALACGCALAVMLNAGWLYTFYLMTVPAVLLAAALILQPAPLARRAGFAVAALLAGACVYRLTRDVAATAATGLQADAHGISKQLRARLEAAADDEFLLFSHEVWASNIEALGPKPRALFPMEDGAWPYAFLRLHWTDTRAMALWRTYFSERVVTALQRRPAPVVIVDESPGQLWNPFTRLQQEPEIRALLSRYAVEHVGTCADARSLSCRFAIWRPR